MRRFAKGNSVRSVAAVFEKGVFRPITPIELPEGTRVIVETEEVASERIRAARHRVYDILARSYETNEPSNVLESHNDHQP